MTAARSTTAEAAAAQLRRLLNVIPRLADGQEHPLARLAKIVGVNDGRQLIADLQSLVDRFDMPGAFVEGVQVWIDSRNVTVVSNHFLRPMRLTMGELCALELGLAVLRAERPLSEHAVLERALGRLRSIITQLRENGAKDGLRAASINGPGSKECLAAIRVSLAEHRKIRVRYQSGTAVEPKWRTICPYGLLFASGNWYVVAHCESSEGLRFFRLDRIEATEPTGDPYVVPPEFALESVAPGGRVLNGAPITMMRVRYSPRIAPWIAEREGIAVEADGSLTIDHPVHDIGWAVRHVLQYGPDAELLDPPELRAELMDHLDVMARAVSAP